MPKKSSYKPEPQPKTEGMLNRFPKPDCPLCKIWGIPWNPNDENTWGKQHIHAEKLWDQWAKGGKNWPEHVCKEAQNLNIQCTPEQARKHFAYHGIEQPAVSGTLDRNKLLLQSKQLHPRLQQIITTIYRQRLMTTKQIQQLFYSHYTPSAAYKAAKKDLLSLAQHHFLYRYLPPTEMMKRRGVPKRFSKQAVWFIGKSSLPYIEETTSLKVWREHYIQMSKEIGDRNLIHDIKAIQLYVTMHEKLQEQNNILQHEKYGTLVCDTLPNNWYGPKHLAIGFHDKTTLQDREIRADGFFSLSVFRTSFLKENSLPSCQMPCFIEYDRGSRDVSKVVDQLYSYHQLAHSKQTGARFPDLNIENYAVPVIMIFSDKDRASLVHKRTQEKTKKTQITEGAPIFITSEEQWLENPFQPNILFSAWKTQTTKYSLLDVLLLRSMPLIESRTVWAEKPLEINYNAAKPTITGRRSEDSMEKGRKTMQQEQKEQQEKQQEKEQKEQQKQQQIMDTLLNM